MAITQTIDGGYIGMCSVGIYQTCSGVFLLKMDNKGDTTWSKLFSCYDFGEDLRKTSDGGYIITGTKTTAIGVCAFLLKLDSLGNKQWEKVYGGQRETTGYGVSVNADGSFTIVGRNQLTPSYYGVYITKVKPNGDSIWTQNLPDQGMSYGLNILQTIDSGYIIVGRTDNKGNKGGYLIKTDQDGHVKWEKTYGITKYDYFSWVLQTNDGGYIIAGAHSMAASYPPNYVAGDAYMAKTDSLGNIIWGKYYGGAMQDAGSCVQKTTDGGYVLAGSTWSFGNQSQAYLVKTDSLGNQFGVGIGQPTAGGNTNSSFKICPNPSLGSFTIAFNKPDNIEQQISI
ncbi:MAG: hypothetical protein SGJ10_08715 [Bacteroidota bacterium]|nr:hypothetical protein [Bacteroidota bacterium]